MGSLEEKTMEVLELSTPAEYVIPENLKLLHELKIIKDTEPGKAFAFVPSFMHIFTSYHKRHGSVIVGLNKAINSYCLDLSKTEGQQVKGTMVSLLAQFDPIFCREWIIELSLTGHKFSEIKQFIDYVLKNNKNINEDKS